MPVAGENGHFNPLDSDAALNAAWTRRARMRSHLSRNSSAAAESEESVLMQRGREAEKVYRHRGEHCCRYFRSAAPPFSRCFNTTGEGDVSRITVPVCPMWRAVPARALRRIHKLPAPFQRRGSWHLCHVLTQRCGPGQPFHMLICRSF